MSLLYPVTIEDAFLIHLDMEKDIVLICETMVFCYDGLCIGTDFVYTWHTLPGSTWNLPKHKTSTCGHMRHGKERSYLPGREFR